MHDQHRARRQRASVPAYPSQRSPIPLHINFVIRAGVTQGKSQSNQAACMGFGNLRTPEEEGARQLLLSEQVLEGPAADHRGL
eukprot:COSAG01_NODE_789_length_13572_cov_322.875158_12_plen_83_part_00